MIVSIRVSAFLGSFDPSEVLAAWLIVLCFVQEIIVMVLELKVSELAGVASKVVNIDGRPIRSSLKKPTIVVNPAMQEGGVNVQPNDLGKDEVGQVEKHVMTYAQTLNSASNDHKVNSGSKDQKVNFRFMEIVATQLGINVLLSKDSVRTVQLKLAFTLYGYFLGDREAFPVVEYFAKSNWSKFGFKKSMMNANGFLFFTFDSDKGMMDVLEGGPWMIRSKPIFLNVWTASSKLQKEDITQLAVWVKLHDVPLVVYTEDGVPKLLDSYTSSMCADAWGGVATLEP